ncbi:glutamine amidotransferases class-II family protein [Brevibacillus laterosporus GI-9]|uniref:glutamate synthase-related protein n=1 Tax=Brevibacillus laterosporus TaxID=1465 RepID=UPI0002403328|nr:glutamate synthase-related protein [Brevibacillus laterosporus]CCF15758.1 glutamine amidotransferases class-II family protein [Brevibacillus laterosporus GI-9]
MQKRNEKHMHTSNFRNYHTTEHDSCGIICIIEKTGTPTRKNVDETIRTLVQMEHRSGFIDGEGDGCGVLTDIPRYLWEKYLENSLFESDLAYDPSFAVAHIFVPRKGHEVKKVQEEIGLLIKKHGLTVLAERENQVHSNVLGKNAQQDEPLFWQIAFMPNQAIHPTTLTPEQYAGLLFELHVEIEDTYHVHVASLSNHTVSYKLMGAANILPRYFVDLADPSFASTVTIGHNRYSTNTLSNFFRVQPFSLLGHNGEINTISKLEEEARMLHVPLVEGGSDSQNLNRTIETFIHRYGLTLFESLEVIFPPIHNEIKLFSHDLQDLYTYLRQAWGHFAQGPAGIVSRYADQCVFSVDSLGLRPVWMVESEESLYFSSEQGIIPVSEMVSEPKSLAPGEKIGVQLSQQGIKIFSHSKLQELVKASFQTKISCQHFRQHLHYAYQSEMVAPSSDYEAPTAQAFSAFGWDREQIQLIEQMASNGAEPIRSLGYDGPLAALSKERQNISDYIKESVAVVTNPAIDRDREIEHFSTRVVLGKRTFLSQKETEPHTRMEIASPLLVEGQSFQELASPQGMMTLEQIISCFHTNPHSVVVLPTVFRETERLSEALDRLAQEACQAVEKGAALLILDDSMVHIENQYFIDPMLITAHIDRALKQTESPSHNLRRQVSIIVRSGAIRSLHDIALLLGSGAEAVAPHILFATVFAKGGTEAVHNLFTALTKGLEKVTSTIGIHELRGYGRLFSAIGLHAEVANILQIPTFCGSDKAGLSLDQLEEESRQRYELYKDEKAREARTFHLFPRLWKAIGQIASAEIPYADYALKLEENEQENPISIRHLTDIAYEKRGTQQDTARMEPEQVDNSVGEHSLPFMISSMSFGSQNETAFRAYAEAADRLNMISMNGEGGEIKDMLGKYPRTRGQQIASGRFGVNVELANSSNLLEIKIGQGAKPGEGGHLPGSKVTEKIAAARNATVGSDLISPSNNHDIYSIEDLAQMITELKTANHQAKVCVKVPIVPNIGTIAVGIAKAGADYITLSGFDGGTGAARVHALQHVGLPAEIGVKAAHNALLEAGLRNQVEIWADGGVKSALDVAKLMMLGANRIGFATLAMIAVGCTTCRGCHLDTCHVGIATQIDNLEEAHEKGLRRFVPRQFDLAVSGLTNLFTQFGQELQRITAKLGFTHSQDLVGRSDLLVQARGLNQMDLESLLCVHPLFTTPKHRGASYESTAAKVLVAAGAIENAELVQERDHYVSHDQPIQQNFSAILSGERVLGSRWSGARVKPYLDGSYMSLPEVSLSYDHGSVPGNGLAAYNAEGVRIRVQGGAQDGVGKTSFGGVVSILKSKGAHGHYINGSVGKSFCYGAQKGLFIVQGNADSRACIRLSGADVVFGGAITEPLQDHLGGLGARANLKGFAFEYMTNGRAVVLGDPGPWICAGMTGGIVYVRLQPELGFDEDALKRRIAKGAKVFIYKLDAKGISDVSELVAKYKEELLATEQYEEAGLIQKLLEHPEAHFVQITPKREQADPSVSTE